MQHSWSRFYMCIHIWVCVFSISASLLLWQWSRIQILTCHSLFKTVPWIWTTCLNVIQYWARHDLGTLNFASMLHPCQVLKFWTSDHFPCLCALYMQFPQSKSLFPASFTWKASMYSLRLNQNTSFSGNPLVIIPGLLVRILQRDKANRISFIHSFFHSFFLSWNWLTWIETKIMQAGEPGKLVV